MQPDQTPSNPPRNFFDKISARQCTVCVLCLTIFPLIYFLGKTVVTIF